MTVVVGCVEKEIVYMGADSAGGTGWEMCVRKDAKIFKRGEFLIGFTDSYRMGQLLRHNLVIPEISKDYDLHEYMCRRFVAAVRECLKDGGYATRENEAEKGGTFLVGVRGRLFTVFSDYQVAENAQSFAAVGCGRELALGAMYSLEQLPAKSRPSPRSRIAMAMDAAERWSSGVRGPFLVYSESDKEMREIDEVLKGEPR